MKTSLPAVIAAAATTLVVSSGAGAAPELSAIEELGKNIFFDEISIPGNKQACASCHDPAKGWILPNSKINASTVVAPGAAPHALGSLKPPANGYASFSPVYTRINNPFSPARGGNFWDGRAEGYGVGGIGPNEPVGDGAVSQTITPDDLPASKRSAYQKYLGPTADQALNPFPNSVEQNIREKNVCQRVKTAKYKELYFDAYGEDIDCGPTPKSNPPYKTSYKRIAVALAAWQSSSEVNSFSSKRDKALAADRDGKFPLDGLTSVENLGHDLFYGITSSLNPTGKNANCRACHNGVPVGDAADPTGEGARQLYSDNQYHNIGIPFNREIPGVAKGEKVGLKAHQTAVAAGFFRTPTLRNVGKGASATFVKAYGHNGYFKSLDGIVHFYNTRDALVKCETLGLVNATEKEALANNCWPESEFAGAARVVIGNLGLSADQEAAIVAYMKALSDQETPSRP